MQLNRRDPLAGFEFTTDSHTHKNNLQAYRQPPDLQPTSEMYSLYIERKDPSTYWHSRAYWKRFITRSLNPKPRVGKFAKIREAHRWVFRWELSVWMSRRFRKFEDSADVSVAFVIRATTDLRQYFARRQHNEDVLLFLCVCMCAFKTMLNTYKY